MKIKIIKIKNGIFKNRVLIEALEDCELCFDSFFGERVFYLKKGKRKIVKISKEDCLFFEGEEVEFDYICNYRTAWQFNWNWVY